MIANLIRASTLTVLLLLYVSLSFANNKQHHSHDEISSVGQPAKMTKAIKTIEVNASDDMQFKFLQKLDLHDGEIVTFKVTNTGKIPHEFSIGDETEQKTHREMMRKMPNMTHEDGNTITIIPGETKTITWQFKSGQEVFFSCNIPGHFEAGMYMKAKIKTN